MKLAALIVGIHLAAAAGIAVLIRRLNDAWEVW